jgi:stage II sporulation protein M
MKHNKKYSILMGFKDNWKQVYETRKYMYFSIFVFALFLILAIAFPVPPEIANQLNMIIKKLVMATEGLNWGGLFSYIFLNNFSVAIMAIFLGIIFGIFPFFIAASNGYILGYIIKLTIQKLGFSTGVISLWRLIPHGIFEILAIVISLGFGFKLGVSLFKCLNERNYRPLLENIKLAVKIIFFVILPLLIIAAVIETSLIKLMG